jgi:hypothetical protein
MNINELREFAALNKEGLAGFKIYLAPTAITKNKEQEIYEGYISINDYPLYSVTGFKSLVKGIQTDKDGKPVLDDFTKEPREINIGDASLQFHSTIGDFQELNENGKPIRFYGKIISNLSKEKQEPFTSAKFKGFELKLLGDTVLKLDLGGMANATGAIALKFDSYSLEAYESNKSFMKELGSDKDPAVLKSRFEPAEAGWNWEDLTEFAKSLADNFPEYQEFIKTNFPSSKIEKRLAKINEKAQSILDKVQARKSGVSQLNAKQKAQVTQGQIDLAKDNLVKAKAKTAVETEEEPF